MNYTNITLILYYHTEYHSGGDLPEKHTLFLCLETLQSPLKQGEKHHCVKWLHQLSHCSSILLPYTRWGQRRSELEASAGGPMLGLFWAYMNPPCLFLFYQSVQSVLRL